MRRFAWTMGGAFAAAALLVMLPVATVRAQPPVRLIAVDIAPHCMWDGSRTVGATCDVVRAAAMQLGVPVEFETMPRARALKIAQGATNVLIFPLARTAQREASFHWHTKLFDEQWMVVARAGTRFSIDNIAAIRKLRVGVIRGGVASELALALGLQNIEEVASEDINARKLAADHIDAWFGARSSISFALHNAGLPPESLRKGVVLARYPIYIASSMQFPQARSLQWKTAFTEARKLGELRSAADRYGVRPSP